MVGEGPEADAGTAALLRVLGGQRRAGGRRAGVQHGPLAGPVHGAVGQKGGALALPDVLITAVGTKVCLLDTS